MSLQAVGRRARKLERRRWRAATLLNVLEKLGDGWQLTWDFTPALHCRCPGCVQEGLPARLGGYTLALHKGATPGDGLPAAGLLTTLPLCVREAWKLSELIGRAAVERRRMAQQARDSAGGGA